MKTVFVLAFAGAAASASATELTLTNSNELSLIDVLLQNPGGSSSGVATAEGTFGLSVFALSDSGTGAGSGGLVNIVNGITTVGETTQFAIDPAVAGLGPDLFDVTSSVTGSGSDFTFTLSITSSDGSSFLTPGLTIGGFPVNGVGISLGDGITGPTFLEPIDPLDFAGPAIITSESTEFFADGALILAGGLGGEGDIDPATGGLLNLDGLSFISTMDITADLFALAPVDQIDITIDFTIIPAPSSAALLGIGGLLAVRRRR